MSRIGKQTIKIPSGVTAKEESGTLIIIGPKGTLRRQLQKEVRITVGPEEITLMPLAVDDLFSKALWGTLASHIINMILGVTKGYEKKLILEGVGFRVSVDGQNLLLSLGFSHPVKLSIPEGIKTTVDKGIITIVGIDKEAVGRFAADVRALKKPEPYKGKGIRYDNEVVRRKQGKKVTA